MTDKPLRERTEASIGETGAYYDAIAQGYNELHGEEQRAKYHLIAERLQLPPNASVLDVGAGTGIGYDIIRSVGIDPSAALLAQHPHPDSRVGIAEALPFPDKSFDAVISVTALHHAEPIAALAELRRVSRGPIAFSVRTNSARGAALIAHAVRVLSPITIIEQEHDRVVIHDPRTPQRMPPNAR